MPCLQAADCSRGQDHKRGSIAHAITYAVTHAGHDVKKQFQVHEGKDDLLALWIRDGIGPDLGHRAPFIDVGMPGFARVLMSAHSRLSHDLGVSNPFRHILHSSHAGALTAYTYTHWVRLASWHCGTPFGPQSAGRICRPTRLAVVSWALHGLILRSR